MVPTVSVPVSGHDICTVNQKPDIGCYIRSSHSDCRLNAEIKIIFGTVWVSISYIFLNLLLALLYIPIYLKSWARDNNAMFTGHNFFNYCNISTVFWVRLLHSDTNFSNFFLITEAQLRCCVLLSRRLKKIAARPALRTERVLVQQF